MQKEYQQAGRASLSGDPVTRPTHPTVQLLPPHECGEFDSRQHAMKHEVTRTRKLQA